MLVPISHLDWQVLRVLVRAEAKGEHPTGRELRLVPTRRTKDGTFLDDLAAAGLIAVAVKPTAPAPGKEAEPAQFRTRYKLTDRGRHAAEYGEYDQAYTPRTDAPLTGVAAELVGPIIEKAARWKQLSAEAEPKSPEKKRKK